MSTLQVFPIGEFLARTESPKGIFYSLVESCPVSDFASAAVEHVAPPPGQFVMGADHTAASLGFFFGQDPRFGSEPDGRRRTNRAVLAAAREAGAREMNPATPALFLGHMFAFGKPWPPNQIFARIDALRPAGYWPVQRLVFLHEPVNHGASCCDLFALAREEVGCGFRVGVVSGDPGHSWGPDTAFAVGLPEA